MTKPDKQFKLPCGHSIFIPYGFIEENILIECYICECIIKSEDIGNESGPHWHMMSPTGGAMRHNHKHKGKHEHKYSTSVQVDYNEGE